MALKCSFCPFCGRDNSLHEAGCISDDCTGVQLLAKVKEVKT